MYPFACPAGPGAKMALDCSGRMRALVPSKPPMAQPFDAARLRLAGDVFPVSDRVGEAFAANTGFGAFSLSADGTLVLGSGESGGSIARVSGWPQRPSRET